MVQGWISSCGTLYNLYTTVKRESEVRASGFERVPIAW